MRRLIRKLWPRARPGRAPLEQLAQSDAAAVELLRSRGVRIGERCRIYSGDFSTEPYLVSIGNDVGIAGGVKFVTHNGAAFLLRGRRPRVQAFGRIVVGDGCFIGENAIILPGTTIANGCIIGAGAVVHGSVPENSLVVGNPATVVGRASLFLERLDRSPDALDTFGLDESERRAIIQRHFATGQDRDDRG